MSSFSAEPCISRAATTGYYYPQDPNTFYAPPLDQAPPPPMEPEDKKNQ